MNAAVGVGPVHFAEAVAPRCAHCHSDLTPDGITEWIDAEGRGDCFANPESINHKV